MNVTGQGPVVFQGEPLVVPEMCFRRWRGVTLGHCAEWNLYFVFQAHSSGGHFSGIHQTLQTLMGKKKLARLVYHLNDKRYIRPHINRRKK